MRGAGISFMIWQSLLFLLVLTDVAWAHDIWINREGRRNSLGEWCCGPGDCHQINDAISGGMGWSIPRRLDDGSGRVYDLEFVPYSEATPSPDGKLWICRRPDQTRRCVFGPPPNS